MPSEKVLEAKKQVAAQLTEKVNKAVAGVIVDYKGITVADDTKLRAELRAAGVEYFVVKNTLLKIATKGSAVEGLSSVLEGTTAIALSYEDPVAAAKILSKYADNKAIPFSIKAGFVDGSILDAEGVNALAKLPSREVLIAQTLGGLNAPITGFANVLNANLRGLVIALNAIAEKQTA